MKLIDPRISIIGDRLKEAREIIVVASGKGGVGKSLVASVLALTLNRQGYQVGLMDLDFTSPSTHLILGVMGLEPREDKGILPPVVHGLEYMSIVHYSGKAAVPLRGSDVSNALIELLSVTRWGALDYLIFDLPPGIGDATMDLIRFINRISFIIVTTPSELALETVRKLINLLRKLDIPIIGIIENMKIDGSERIRRWSEELGVRFLGEVPYDPFVEEAIGNVEKLLRTEFARRIERICQEIFLHKHGLT